MTYQQFSSFPWGKRVADMNPEEPTRESLWVLNKFELNP